MCIAAKKTRFPLGTVRQRALNPIHINHLDVCGEIKPKAYDNKISLLTCIDDYTHLCKVSLLNSKMKLARF